ncbi:hypothetical protein Tco_1315697 [Tanacetum coccineum]
MQNGLCWNQRKYCIELLHEYGLLACKHVATPMPENDVLPHNEADDDNQHIHSPLQSHFEAALRVLMYLKSTHDVEAEYRSMASAPCEISANPVIHEKNKHFYIDVHLVMENVASRLIKTVKVDFEN